MTRILLILLALPLCSFGNPPLGFGHVVNQNINPEVLTYIKQSSQNNFRDSEIKNKSIRSLKRGRKVQLNKFYGTKSTTFAYKESEKFYIIKPATNIKSIFTDTLEQIYYLIDEDIGYFQIISIDTSKATGIKFISGNISKPYYLSFKDFSDDTHIQFSTIEYPGFTSPSNLKNKEIDTFKINLWLVLQTLSYTGPRGLVFDANFNKENNIKVNSFSPRGFNCKGYNPPKSINDNFYFNFPEIPYTRGNARIQFGIENKYLVSKKIECFAKNNELIKQLNIDAFSFTTTIKVEPPLNNVIVDDSHDYYYLKYHDSSVVRVIDSAFNIAIDINNSTIKSRETIVYGTGIPIEDTLYIVKKMEYKQFPSDVNKHLIFYWSYCQYFCPYVFLPSEEVSYTYNLTYNPRNNKTYVKVIDKCRKEGFTKEIISIK